MDKETIVTLVTVPLDEAMIADIRSVSPLLKIEHLPVKNAEEIPLETWNRAEILYTARLLPDPAWVPNLRWVQCHFAGIDHLTNSELIRKENINFTTMSGAASSQTAEYALTMMLALGRNMPELFRLQDKSEWASERWEKWNPVELRGSTVGLVGYGSINRQVARLLQPFGATVLAAKANVRKPEDEGYSPEGQGDPAGDLFTRLYPIQALQSMLKLCDFVVVAVPETTKTARLIGAAEIQAMKPSAFLINLGRGNAIDLPALTNALENHRIAGAALDVFPNEPLPADDPLWKLPNVIVTPHVAGLSSKYAVRAIELFKINLQRYLNSEPLLNSFVQKRGY